MSGALDTEKGSLAEVTDVSCTVEFIEIVPLDGASDDYQKLEFIDPVAEVKPEVLQKIKQEPADENDNEDPNYFVKQKQEPHGENENRNPHPYFSVKQEPPDEYETQRPCFVSFDCTTTFSHCGQMKMEKFVKIMCTLLLYSLHIYFNFIATCFEQN